MAHASTTPGGVTTVHARKSEMKAKGKKTLREVSVRKQEKGFTVSEQYDHDPREPGWDPPGMMAFSTAAEVSKHLATCLARLGVDVE